MGKLSSIVSCLKKHEFLAVTALCMAAIIVITFGFSLVAVITALTGSEMENIEGQPEQSVKLNGQLNQEELAEGDPVEFRDQALAAAIAMAIGVEPSELTSRMLQSMTALDLSDNPDIRRLDDLSMMPNLESLTIKNCGLKSILPIVGLTELKELNLSGNKISDISALLEMTWLEKLDVSNNPIDKVPNLSGMEDLVALNLDDTGVADLSFMQGASVSELHISYTNINNIAILSECEKLESLYMYGFNFMDLTPLQQLPHFHSIYLSQGFDHSQVDFLAGRFMMADKYTRVYLVLKNRGIDVYG